MGGVDIADQKRLFCESRIHGLSRWWIRVFFYYVDVGTVNAMVLYRKSIASTKTMNLRDFKMSWVTSYCGERIRGIIKPILVDLPSCHLVQMTRRNRCAWCCTMHKVRNDSSLACKGCCSSEQHLYFCNPAVRPCYFQAHKCESTRMYIMDKEQVCLKKKRSRTTVVTPVKKGRTTGGALSPVAYRNNWKKY